LIIEIRNLNLAWRCSRFAQITMLTIAELQMLSAKNPAIAANAFNIFAVQKFPAICSTNG
jgi:hypothetical protein